MGFFNSRKKSEQHALIKKPANMADIDGYELIKEIVRRTEELDAPWIRAGMAHDDRNLRMSAQVSNWRMAFFFMLVIAALAVGGIVHIGSLSKFVPMLVEVDQLGRTVAVKALTGDDAITDPKRLALREMFELIENLRTVTTDVSANNRNLTKGFSRLIGAAENYAKTELKKAPPNVIGATKTVQIQVKVALPVSDSNKRWQVEWEELSYTLNGELMATEKWKATLEWNFVPSGDEKVIRENPTGFTVSELTWTKVI